MDLTDFQFVQRRRDFLAKCCGGLGMAALGDLLTADGLTAATVASTNPLAPSTATFMADDRT